MTSNCVVALQKLIYGPQREKMLLRPSVTRQVQRKQPSNLNLTIFNQTNKCCKYIKTNKQISK